MRILVLGFLFLVWPRADHAQVALPMFPEPEKLLKSEKQFNAVMLGPGNTFSVREVPADLRLEAFDFSKDETLIYTEWASGRVETQGLVSGKKFTEFKVASGPVFQIEDNKAQGELVVVLQHGIIRIVDARTGKKRREIAIQQGKLDYDIQHILLAQDGSWLAYVNQDNGKVLDLRGEVPMVLADLGDAYDIALSPDQTQLWVVNRSKLFGLQVNGWKLINTAGLLDQVRPEGTPTLAVVTGPNGPSAFVPSKSGLLRYELPSLVGRKITETPTYWLAADPSHNLVFVREFKASATYDSNGAAQCRWQMRPAQDFKMSPSGRWLGYRNFGAVELWSTDKLVKACPTKAG